MAVNLVCKHGWFVGMMGTGPGVRHASSRSGWISTRRMLALAAASRANGFSIPILISKSPMAANYFNVPNLIRVRHARCK